MISLFILHRVTGRVLPAPVTQLLTGTVPSFASGGAATAPTTQRSTKTPACL